MMLPGNPFDAGRDEELGALLRRHLDPGGHEAWTSALLARIGSGQAESSWAILAHWLRPGIAAAAVLLAILVAWLLVSQPVTTQPGLAEAVRPGDAPAQLFTTARPDQELILGLVLEGGH